MPTYIPKMEPNCEYTPYRTAARFFYARQRTRRNKQTKIRFEGLPNFWKRLLRMIRSHPITKTLYGTDIETNPLTKGCPIFCKPSQWYTNGCVEKHIRRPGSAYSTTTRKPLRAELYAPDREGCISLLHMLDSPQILAACRSHWQNRLP